MDLLDQFLKQFGPKKKSRFVDIEKIDRCRHPSHNPPSHLHIPFGKKYIHVCDGCGQETILMPPQITL